MIMAPLSSIVTPELLGPSILCGIGVILMVEAVKDSIPLATSMLSFSDVPPMPPRIEDPTNPGGMMED